MWRFLGLVILALALSFSARARAAEAGATPEAEDPGTLVISDGARLYRLDQTLELQVNGALAGAVLAEWEQPLATRNLKLYLDGVEMKGLKASVLTRDKTVKLSFTLSRDPNDDENRTAWNALLAKQAHYTMQLPVSLAIGRKPPVGATAPDVLRFEIANPSRISLVTWGAVGLFLVLFSLLVFSKPLSRMVRDAGTDYFSLGKTQMAFWGLLVFVAVVAIYLITGSLERVPPQTLTLLGISSATSLAAILVGNTKRTAKVATLTKLEAEKTVLEQAKSAGKAGANEEARLAVVALEHSKLEEAVASGRSLGFWRDICDGGDGLSFHRVQVVIWTGLLGVAFIQAVAKSVSLPEFPQSLLLLMGISNGTYLGLKVPE